MSKFYETDETDPDAPVELDEHEGLRPGVTVRYTGTIPLRGPLVVTELLRFGDDYVLAVLNDGEYEVVAENLAVVE